MRTTLDPDDDVLLEAKELARQRGVSTGKALSALARQALMPRQTMATRNGVPLFPIQPDAGVVTMEIVNQLRDESP